MDVDISRTVMPIRVSADDGGMTGEVFFAEFQAKCLCLFHGQAVVGCISWVKADDILVTFDITMLGVLAILAVCQQTGRCKREIATLKGVEQVRICDKHYLLYGLQSQFVQHQISWSEGTGTTVSNLRIPHLEQIRVPYVPLDQQKKISSVLYALEDKIENNRKLNDNLEQQAVALFKSWFIDFSLFGGTVPENWEDTTLENITTLITRGIAPKYSDNSDQTVVNQKCIRNHTIDLSLARTHTPKAINEKWLKFGDLLINSTGDGTLGRVAQVWFAPKALTVDSHVTIVRPAREELIFYIGLWGILHEKEIESLHTGSTGQTELPRDRVKMLKLLLPDDSSLSRFNSIIAPMTSTIISNQEENQKLANLRDTLLPKLMSGVIDVANVQL